MQAIIISMSLPVCRSPVWRHLAVPADYHFNDLAEVMKIAAGYHKEYIWEFLFNELKARITNNSTLVDQAKFLHSDAGKAHLATIDQERHEIDLSVAVEDGRNVPIAALFEKYKTCRFLYDLTDEWIWQVEVLDFIDDYEGPLPRIIEALGTAPFEDVGGIEGYDALVELLVNDGEEAEEVRTWLENDGACFFDLDDANKKLKMKMTQKDG